MMESLKESTRDYLHKICQPTIAHICQTGKSERAMDLRKDLFAKATISIAHGEFKPEDQRYVLLQ